MRLVVIESPYAGDVERNLRYLRACMADCLARGEAPYASHALYTQPGVLDDTIPAERTQGIAAGFAWGDCAEACVVYTDCGVSAGMEQGIAAAKASGKTWGGSQRGRICTQTKNKVGAVQKLHAGGTSISEISRAVGLSRPTIYRLLRATAPATE